MDVETLTYRIEVEGADKARREMSDTSDHVTGKAKAGADGIEEGSRRGVGALSKITGALGPIGGVIGGAFAVGKVVDFGKEMFGLGQELDVYNKKADTVFEGGAGLVKAWADQNNEAMGLSKEKLTGLAAGFGDLLKPMGFSAEQAGKMSTEVVGLSGALSAWSGGQTSAAEVSDILAKAMLGETDGLKQLGISISQDEVNTRLARDGKEKLTGAELVHREYTGRPRSYVMRNEATPGLPLPDEEPLGIDGMVAEVVAEMQSEIDRLPQVSTDPRLDRLEEINRDLR